LPPAAAVLQGPPLRLITPVRLLLSTPTLKQYLADRLSDGPIEKQIKIMQQVLKELKSKRKMEHNAEVDFA
jgi:hypothetical protein